MKIEVKIDNDILGQFSRQLNAKEELDSIQLDSTIGKGQFKRSTFPNSLEFYHVQFRLKNEVEMHSINPENSDYFLLNINLSEKELGKKVNGEEINFQKYLPSGILFYPPSIEITSNNPVNVDFEIVLIKFHKSLLRTYFENQVSVFDNLANTIVYEDLDVNSEKLLKEIINNSDKLKSHSNLLAFLSIFFDKLKKRENNLQYENLHPQDIKQLFLAASLLRNPTPTHTPTIDELAKVANMGKTKFKNTFKQVFGSPPKQYHQKIRMEYAKKLLLSQQKNSTELAYELGYTHPSKFTRAFKNYFGEVPSKLS